MRRGETVGDTIGINDNPDRSGMMSTETVFSSKLPWAGGSRREWLTRDLLADFEPLKRELARKGRGE